MQTCLYVLIMFLAKYKCYVNQFYLALLKERHVIFNFGGALISSWISQVCSIHFSTCKISSHQVACEDVGQSIFGANAFNANITLLLMVSYEMVPYVNVLGS